MGDPEGTGTEETPPRKGENSPVTLIVLPLVIVLAWMLENYLLAGNPRLFAQASLSGLVIYTVLSGLIVGILVPVVRVRAAFLSGAVNMFQIGLRSLRRTVAAVSLTALAGYAVFVFLSLAGQGLDRGTAAMLFLFLLPTAIAAVMLCWVLAGTHVQASVRSGGIVVSVLAGVLLTTLVFAFAMTVIFAVPDPRDHLIGFLALGFISAIIFFAVRDVWATVIVVTEGLVLLLAPAIDPAYLASPVAALCGILSVLVLMCVHGYFSRHYTTIVLPGR
jgi:hypothetical protein